MVPRECGKDTTVCLREDLVIRVLEDDESVVFTPRGLPEAPHSATLPELRHSRVHAAYAPAVPQTTRTTPWVKSAFQNLHLSV